MPAKIFGNPATVVSLLDAFYNTAPGNPQYVNHLAFADANGEAAYAAALGAGFAGVSDDALAATVLTNMGVAGAVPAASYDALVTALASAFAAFPTARGQVVLNLTKILPNLESDVTFGAAATAYNNSIYNAYAYSANPGNLVGTQDPGAPLPTFTITPGTTAGGTSVAGITGNQDVIINFDNPTKQVSGLDVDGDGTVELNGIENNFPYAAANYSIVDAYSRNPLNQGDSVANYLGDLQFDGRSFAGDGVGTNGNIVLGGLGADIIFGGVGNDFITGGGIAANRFALNQTGTVVIDSQTGRPATHTTDDLSGGRNADFFFVELSMIDPTDGVGLNIDGGTTSDDIPAGTAQSAQDNDWLLLEASDDDEPVTIILRDDSILDTVQNNFAGNPVVPSYAGETLANVATTGNVYTRAGVAVGTLRDIENVDASGNTYGFLKGFTSIGEAMTDDRITANPDNDGIGSGAQLVIHGSNVNNILIGGYDNDAIFGVDGNDLLMGGNLNKLIDPNLLTISNNGRDDLIGGAGADDLVFETDGGVYEGGTTANTDDAEDDTLWLTKELFGASSRTAANQTTDGVVRLDLAVGKTGAQNGGTGQLGNSAGYGGADMGVTITSSIGTYTYTADQTNYKAGVSRSAVQDMESVIATGLGSVDYKAAGANTAADQLGLTNQQNFLAYNGDLDLRGTDGANTFYASSGNDKLEGRMGNDKLSGGAGNDDFIFRLTAGAPGDGVDVIHRQVDANGDNIWDVDAKNMGLFGRDFGLDSTTTKGASQLVVDLGTTNLADVNVALTSFTLKIGGATGTVFSVADANALADATSAAQVAAIVNAAYSAADANVTATAVGNTIVVKDAAGRDISDTVAEGYFVGGVVANGAFSAQATFTPAGEAVSLDRLIYQSYEDRADGEKTNDDSLNGSQISLGVDSYAEDLVISFGADGTRIAEDQSYVLTFTNLTTQDVVTINVNNVLYKLKVGVDLDGNAIAAEDGEGGDTQPGIQAAFLTRLTAFINSFMDNDTAAGQVAAATDGATTITLTQVAYNSEETVFMTTPVVTIANTSAGEIATVVVTNTSQHEVHLLDFDGRGNALNRTNVLFLGDTGTQRAILETAKAAGGAMAGTEAVVVDGGADDLQGIQVNTATNVPLALNFSVHGDDFLLGGAGIDNISAGTGDDRVIGSVGSATVGAINGTDGERADGGKDWYAVQVLGESGARVLKLNKWEAANPSLSLTAAGMPLAGLALSSVTLINQTESGSGLVSGLFDDTLQFQQADFTAGATRFTITLDDFNVVGGVVQLRNDGAGVVGVDVDGNGTLDNFTRFSNFENIRTVSGQGNAVAGDGQGNDTLNVSALSTATGGISYDLTNAGTAGNVMYSANAHASLTRPVVGDFESLVIKVDGVESVIGGDGDDLLTIDETEAAKNNTFTGGLGDDRIDYTNFFAGEATDGAAEPTVTIKVNSAADQDQVVMTGGRLGLVVATDTLNSVELIALNGNTAEGTRENDVLDVTSMTTGAIVNYADAALVTPLGTAFGSVRDLGGVLQVVIENLQEIENVWADGNDTVIVADAAIMGTNARDDSLDGTPSKDLPFATFMDFDTLTALNARIPFLSQSSAQITNGYNIGQFTFSLSKTGTGIDTDTVDYSQAADAISVVVELDAARPNQYVLVDASGATFGGEGDLDNDQGDRVDVLVGVERVVASLNESVLDLSSSTKGLEIKFSAFDVANQVAALDRDVYTVKIADLASSVPLTRSFIEYRDAGLAAGVTQGTATWNRIEGSDNAEVVILNSAHSFDNDTFNLRGGANQVKYNELTKSITLTLGVTDFVATTALTTGLISGTVNFQDGNGGALAGAGQHTISSYTANNGIATGSLRIAASQDAEDTLALSGASDKLFLLAEAGTTDNQITVRIGAANALNSVVLTGFELVTDAGSNDAYDMASLSAILAGLTLTDNGGADHDAIIVRNDAVNFNASGANTIDLDNISATAGGFNFDFDVLDVTKVTATNLILNGGTDAAPANADTDTTDEVVLGALAGVLTIADFEAMVLTQASLTAGTVFAFNAGAGTLTQGATTINTSADVLSFGGLVFEGEVRNSYVADVTTGVTVTVQGSVAATVHGGAAADTITGAGGADTLRGNGGADILDGGTAGEVRQIQLDGILDAAANTVTISMDGLVLTLNEVAAIVDTDANAGDNLDIIQGSGSDAVGAALAQLVNANLTDINDGVRFGGVNLLNASYSATTDLLTFTFANGQAVLVTDTIVVADTDAGTFAASAETTTTEGGDGGIDTFVFADTAANNGADIINGFVATAAGVTDDLLDFTAFLGGAAVENVVPANFTAGLSLLGAANVGVVFNKTGGTLAAGDIAVAAAASKVAVENDSKAVVLVSADADGATDATNQAYNVYYVQDTLVGAGQTYTVTLVGTINSSTELNAADLAAAATFV